MCFVQLHTEKHKNNLLQLNLSKFLQPDQLQKLQRPQASKSVQWSSETIKRALAIRSLVGKNGYEHLRKMSYPLPAYRTLCQRLENSPFAPGIQSDVLQWLKQKLADYKDYEKVCVLMVDEMQLKQRVEYDKSLHKVVGYVSPETLPSDAPQQDKEELASHAMVFMLRGLTSSWKQTVAYLYSGMTFKKEPYWQFMKQVIAAVEECGLIVQAVTSDMGPINVALWKHIGIQSTKTKVCSSIEHPFNPDRTIHFLADPPHLLKNLWNSVITHKISLSPQTIKKYGLSHDLVDSSYVKKLIEMQQNSELRIAFKLQNCHINPSQYEKMRVSLAAQFFSQSTASALEVCVRLDKLPIEALTTAWFLRSVNNWFDAMNARHKPAGLFRNQTAKLSTLSSMIDILKDVTFSDRKIWKPVQCGIQLSTSSVLQLSDNLMKKYNLQYFLTGRLTQDPVENLFSQIRGRGVSHPSCTVFRQALRMTTVAQYLDVNKAAAYDEDGCTYLVDYMQERNKFNTDEITPSHSLITTNETSTPLSHTENTALCMSSDFQLYEESCTTSEGCYLQELLDTCLLSASGSNDHTVDLTAHAQVNGINHVMEETVQTSSENSQKDSRVKNVEKKVVDQSIGDLEGNALHDIAGWAVSKVLAKIDCVACTEAFVSVESNDEVTSQYTSIRTYGGLTHATKQTINALRIAESVFRTNRPLLHELANAEENITHQITDVLNAMDFDYPVCHDTLYHVIQKA